MSFYYRFYFRYFPVCSSYLLVCNVKPQGHDSVHRCILCICTQETHARCLMQINQLWCSDLCDLCFLL